MILLDTNLLARMTDSAHSHCAASRRSVHVLLGRSERLVIVKSHDARLVAAMQTYGSARILTFNANDFKGYPITIIDPASV